MTSINEIFTTFGPEYLQRYANRMPKTHLKAIPPMSGKMSHLELT